VIRKQRLEEIGSVDGGRRAPRTRDDGGIERKHSRILRDAARVRRTKGESDDATPGCT
jgi:hypothetical protein